MITSVALAPTAIAGTVIAHMPGRDERKAQLRSLAALIAHCPRPSPVVDALQGSRNRSNGIYERTDARRATASDKMRRLPAARQRFAKRHEWLCGDGVLKREDVIRGKSWQMPITQSGPISNLAARQRTDAMTNAIRRIEGVLDQFAIQDVG